MEPRASHLLGKHSTLSYSPIPVLFLFVLQYWDLNSGPHICMIKVHYIPVRDYHSETHFYA
jgi:hypothetical protein